MTSVELRYIPWHEIRAVAAGLFANEEGRAYWSASRSDWFRVDTLPQRRFVRIVEQEYRRAIASDATLTGPKGQTRKRSSEGTPSLLHYE